MNTLLHIGSLLAALLAPLAARAEERLPAFGVVSDIQYGDKAGDGGRDYRGSLGRLERCVETFNAQPLDFVIQLGDVIDGQPTAAATTHDLDAVLSVFNRLSAPKHHVVGNHCLNAGTNALLQRLGLARAYYAFTVPRAAGWRFVVLDGSDAGYGVMGAAQLAWFRETLDQAQRAGERVICFCHYALLPEAAEHHRMAQPEAVLKLLDEHPCAVAWIAGHDHAGGYALRRTAHHLTMRGMVEAPTNGTAFARFELAGDRLLEHGYGAEPSRELILSPAPSMRRHSFENAAP